MSILNIGVKLGTCESLYYVTYPKFLGALLAGLLSRCENNLAPDCYVKPDSGFLFRFPFPDEDHLPFGDIGAFGFRRTLPFTLDKSVLDPPAEGNGAPFRWNLPTRS